MKIYLAELSHKGNGRSPNVVPLASGYLAAYLASRHRDLEIKIFRDPDDLLSEMITRPADVVGFSVYDWSENLSSFCAERVKDANPSTVTIAGGASVDDVDDELRLFLDRHPEFDVCAPNEGEIALLRLVEHLMSGGRVGGTEPIDGCAWFADGELVRGPYSAAPIEEIPSPYLGGFLDKFLADGYDPVLQSMRGCPYRCTFCVSGNSNWSKMVGFSLERVKAEFEHIRERTSSDYLILTDENLGILRDRDVEFAEYLVQSFESVGYPARLYFYTAKLVTDHVLKVVETIAPIGEFGISFQTLDEKVRQEIKRTNTRWPKFTEYVAWARERNIQSSTELIFGLPGETAAGYVEGMEKLLRTGVDRIYSYNLRLLSGIDLATRAGRAKYEFETKYRLPDRDYGRYQGVVVNEVEEVVVGSASFDFEDYLAVRRYGLFLELASGRGYLSDLIALMVRIGLPGEKLVAFLAASDFEDAPLVGAVVADYQDRARAELFDTPEECTHALESMLDKSEMPPETKINYVFVGKLILDPAVRAELFTVIRGFVETVATNNEERLVLVDFVENVALPRVVSFGVGEERVVRSTTSVDLAAIGSAATASELLGKPVDIEWELHPDARRFIEQAPSATGEAALQDVYMTVSRFGLLRRARPDARAGIPAESG